MTRRIAMWSGPRNLSTAMMYSFAQRSDCRVVDEPFYAAYLALSGLDHPMRNEVLASQAKDPTVVQQRLSETSDMPLHYEKHMCQHMVEGIPRDWMAEVTNVFLIRHPARVIASFAQKIPDLTAQDIGFDLQAELYAYCSELGQKPIVIDSYDIRQNPEAMLRQLCAALGLAFEPAMLSWAKGGIAEDGVWAPVWYGAVHNSTGFAGAEEALPDLSEAHHALCRETLEPYHAMKAEALMPAS